MSRSVFALYKEAPILARAHLRVRWITCPFGRVADHVPEGRILEIGCGHGLFSNHLAATNRRREVVGIDIDADKIAHAERAAAPGTRFLVTRPGELPPGPWDGIVIVDVLYLIDPHGQRALLSEATRNLAPEGRLVVKEMAPRPRWKARWNRVQEFVSVRVLRITAGDRIHPTDPTAIRSWLEHGGLEVEARSIDRGYPHPHHLLVGRVTGRGG